MQREMSSMKKYQSLGRITHVEEKGSCLVLWIEPRTELVLQVERAIERFSKSYSRESVPTCKQSLQIGQMVCVSAGGGDQSWLRAKVVDLQEGSAYPHIQLFLVDSGRTKQAELKELRLLQAHDQLLKLEPLALRYVLAGVAPADTETCAWQPDFVKSLHATLTPPMVVVNYRVEGGEKTPHLVAVWFNGVDLATWLVSSGYARSVSCEYQLERLSSEAVEVCRAQPLKIGPLAAEKNAQTPTVEWAQEKQPGVTDSSSPQNPNPFKWISQNTSSNASIKNRVKIVQKEELMKSGISDCIPNLQIGGLTTQSTNKSDVPASAPRNTSPSQTPATVVSEQTSADRSGELLLGDSSPSGGSQTTNPYRRHQQSAPQDVVMQASGRQPKSTDTRELKQEAIQETGLSYQLSMGTAPHPTAPSQVLSPSELLSGPGMQPRFFPPTFPASMLQHIPPSAQARQQFSPFSMYGQFMAPPSGLMEQQQGNPSQQLMVPPPHLTGGADSGLMPCPAGPPQAWQLAMLAQAQAMQGPQATQQPCEPALQHAEVFSQAQGYQKLALKPGMEYRAVVCHVDLSGTVPWTFSCQLERHQALLQQINNAAQEAWATLTEPAIIPDDRPLLARYAENSLWYRATVVKHHSPRRVTVRFADFGNEAEVRSKDTRETPPWPVFQHPALAFTCRLQMADTLKQASLGFSRLTLGRLMIVRTLHELPGGEVLVRVLDPATEPPRDIALNIVAALEESVALSTAPLEPSEERASKPSSSVPGSVINWETTTRTVSCDPSSTKITIQATWKDQLLPQLQSGTERTAEWCLQQQTLLDDAAAGGVASEREYHPVSQASDAGSRDVDLRWQDSTADEAPGTSRGSRVEPAATVQPARSAFDTVSVCRQSQHGSDAQEDRLLSSRKDQCRSENAEPVTVQPSYLWPGEVLPHAVMSSAKNPSELHVQLSQNPKLCELQRTLQAAARHAPALERVKPGDFCLARWPNDKKWYRGKVEPSDWSMCVHDGSTSVYLLDYGDSVQVEETRALPAALSELPAQALCCSLRGVQPARGANTWSKEQMTKLNSILNNHDIFVVEIVGVDEDGRHSVVFYDDNTLTLNQELGASLASLAPLHSLPQPPPPSGRVLISHFVNPHDFYVVPFSREPGRITLEIEAQLQVYPTTPSPGILQPGLLVLAQYEDSRWYRARLIDTRGDYCKLLLIDSGITRTIASSRLALLPDSLLVEAPFAVPCRLAGVLPLPRGPGWLEGRMCNDKVAQVFGSSRTFLVHRCEKAQGDRHSVDLIMEQDKLHLAEVLVTRGLVVGDATTQNDEESLASGGSCRVVVNHVEDLSFFVQPLSVAGQLRKLSREMAQLDSAPREMNLTNLAAAKSSLDDGWHRVLVVSPPAPQDVQLTVMFVDYGNTEQVARNKLKRLPARLSKLRPFATRCSLPLRIKPKNTSAATRKLMELLTAAKHEGVIQVLCRLPGGTLVVELMLGDASVSAVLEEAGLAESLLELVYVSAASSSSHFFMQLSRQKKDIIEIEKYLMKIAQSQPFFTRPKPYQRCMARYNGSWCRVKVLSTTARTCEVQYIDHGTTAQVTELRALPADLKNTKKFALECTLRRPACNKEEEERFLRITQDETKELIALMPTQFARNPIQVVLLLDGEDVMPAPLWEVEKEEADLRVLLGLQDPAQHSEAASEAVHVQKKCAGNMESSMENDLVSDSESITNTQDLHPAEAPEAAQLAEEQATESTELTKVLVSFYESPCSVWVNKSSDAAKVDEVQTRLPSELGCTPLDLTALLGRVCAARYKQDNNWYRARLLQTDPPRVLYIDFGNTDDDVEELRCLSEALSEMPPLALRFALRLAPRDDDDSCRRLRELLSDDSTEFQVELSDLDAVSMFVNGKDIYQLIEYTPPTTTDFTISHFESVDKFYIQLDGDMPELERLQNRLNKENGDQEFKPLHCAEVGTVCLGKFPIDSNIGPPYWYRVRVLQIHSESNDVLEAAGNAPDVIEAAEENTDIRRSEVTALLLDYGNEERISELRHLPLDFAELAPLAIQCKLVVPSQNPKQKASLATLLETIWSRAETTTFQAVLPSLVHGPLVLERVWLQQGHDLVALAARDVEDLGLQEPLTAPETPQGEGEKANSSEVLAVCENQPDTENIPFSAEYNLTEAVMTGDLLNLEKYDSETEKESPNFDQLKEMSANCINQYQTVDDLLTLEETQQEQNITGILKPSVFKFNSSVEPMVGGGTLVEDCLSNEDTEGILAVASELVSSHGLNLESKGGALSDQSTETDVDLASTTSQHAMFSPDEDLIDPVHQVLSSPEVLPEGKSSPPMELIERTSPFHLDVIESVSSSDVDFTECLSSLDSDFTECISPEVDPTDDLPLPEEEITQGISSPVEDSAGNDSPLDVNPTEVASYPEVDSTTSTPEVASSPLQKVLLFPEYSTHSSCVMACEEKMTSETEIPSLDDVDLTDLFVSSPEQHAHSESDSDVLTSYQADPQADLLDLSFDLEMMTNSSPPSNSTASDPWSVLLAETMKDEHQEQLHEMPPLLLPLPPPQSIVKDAENCLDSESLDSEDCLDDPPTQARQCADASSLEESQPSRSSCSED